MSKNKSAAKRLLKKEKKMADQAVRLERLNKSRTENSAAVTFCHSYEQSMSVVKAFFDVFREAGAKNVAKPEWTNVLNDLSQHVDTLNKYYSHSKTVLGKKYDFTEIFIFERNYCLGNDTDGEFANITEVFEEFLSAVERAEECRLEIVEALKEFDNKSVMQSPVNSVRSIEDVIVAIEGESENKNEQPQTDEEV